MKTLRYFAALLTFAFSIGLSLIACNDKSETLSNANLQQEHLQPTIVNVPEINKEVKDSLDKYTARIDSISKHSKMAIKDVASIKGTVSALQDNEKWWRISFGICVIAIIITIICLIRCAELKKRLDRHRLDIEGLKSEKQSASFAQKNMSKTSVPYDYESLTRRVCDLEIQIGKLTSVSHPVLKPVEPVAIPNVKEPRKNGYFGNPINAAEPYFKKILVSRDSEARFIAEITGNMAIFRPVDSSSYLGTFVSNDAMRAAIDFTGCAPSEASSMKVNIPGEAIQRDNKWVITKKATVYLS